MFGNSAAVLVSNPERWPMISDATSNEKVRLARLFSSKKSKAQQKKIDFKFASVPDFVDWWHSQFTVQSGSCAYCQTSIVVIANLIKAEHLSVRKVRGGACRGPVLELDRKDPKGPYAPANCALACYYCNNDKSYIYDGDTYRQFFGPARKKHFEFLAAKHLGKSGQIDIQAPSTG
jgi:5-methylcytosine-specific restriction endonuclease McrA